MDEIAEKPVSSFALATITALSSNGAKLKIDGNDEAGDKNYNVNVSASLTVGDRVLLAKVSGTYIVLCAIGKPNKRAIPAGGQSGYVLKKLTADNFSMYWSTDKT